MDIFLIFFVFKELLSAIIFMAKTFLCDKYLLLILVFQAANSKKFPYNIGMKHGLAREKQRINK